VGKNVAVFVDVANIFYAAKAAGVDIDYVTLLKSATAGRDLVRAYAYTGLDPDNENQRNFHDFLRRSNYKVVSKDIRKYGDGKVKANLDIELVVDMMKTARNLDIAIVVSGDGDFAPAIRAVQEQGVRVEVISFRGNTSSDLIDVADQFTDIVQLARVEKGSRSGRRVAEDDADLSMTEVPDKLTEGTGVGRGGRGRGRGRARDEEPAAAARGRGRGRAGAAPTGTAVAASAAGLVALPGERLARVGGLTEADLAAAEVFTLDEIADDGAVASGSEPGAIEGLAEDGEPRRRRRRGGRGRGRGRGRGDELQEGVADEAPPAARVTLPQVRDVAARDIEEEDEEIVPARRAPKTTPFGSVWDSQIGTPTAPAAASLAPIGDDEDFDEPEIPEYLIAEQRRGANRGGGGRGVRGGRSAYQSAMDRERFGRGGGGGGGGGGARGGSRGINRYPDVSGRTRPVGPAREERGYGRQDRDAAPSAPRGSSEPWSDVPPELEALLRAQVAQKPAPGRPSRGQDDRARTESVEPPAEPGIVVEADVSPTTEPVTTRKRAIRVPGGRTSRTARAKEAPAPEPVATLAVADDGQGAAEAGTTPKRRPGRPRKSVAEAGDGPLTEGGPAGAASTTKAAPKPRAAAKPRTIRKSAAEAPAAVGAASDAEGTDAGPTDATVAAAPKRRTTRKATPAEPA
jgi:uncharacterized LabA/DUF88 family protein